MLWPSSIWWKLRIKDELSWVSTFILLWHFYVPLQCWPLCRWTILLGRRCAYWKIFSSFFFQAAHQEIKSHGQTIKSIVSICEQFSSKRSHYCGKKHQAGTQPPPPPHQVPSCGQSCSSNKEDVGRSIERRWHCLWLRSLEWQCYLEQLTWTPNLKKKVCAKKIVLSKLDVGCENKITAVFHTPHHHKQKCMISDYKQDVEI